MFPISPLDAKVGDSLQQTFLFSSQQTFLTEDFASELGRRVYSPEKGCVTQLCLLVRHIGLRPALLSATRALSSGYQLDLSWEIRETLLYCSNFCCILLPLTLLPNPGSNRQTEKSVPAETLPPVFIC